MVLALGAGQAYGAITPQPSNAVGATAIATAIASPSAGATTGSYDAVPPSGTPNGTADSLSFFPTDGTSFGILTSGDVNLADDPNTSGSSGAADGGGSVRGNSDLDVTILKIDLVVPTTANCLTIDFAFYSDEFPEFVGSGFNDAFIAELDTSTWTTSGSTISAPDNFAFDANGDVISINSTGATGMSSANAAGTTYDGATTLLFAATPVTPGAHSLYLSIFDQGDQAYDSAAFVDNLAFTSVANPATDCKKGAAPVADFALSLEPESADNPLGTDHTVTATLTDQGNPMSGATISFAVTGANSASGTGTTDSNGQATFTYTGSSPGTDTITACFDETGDGPCEAEDTATKEWNPPASLELTPATAINTVDSQHCVTATVEDVNGDPTPNQTVRFSVTGSVTTSGSATTDSSGEAQFCYTGPALPGADSIGAFADTNNNGTDDGASEPDDTAQKTWVVPASTAGCKITDGGRIKANNGDKATFGANAHATTPLKGQQNYQDHGPAQPMHVKATTISAVTCSTDKKQGRIFGTATINGAGSFQFRIDVKDLGEPGTNDTYRIRLSNGYDSGEKKLEGGNIQIHK